MRTSMLVCFETNVKWRQLAKHYQESGITKQRRDVVDSTRFVNEGRVYF